MTVKSLVLVCGIVAGSMMPSAASAQLAPTTLTSTPAREHRAPEGKATDTTDKIGQKHQPASVKHIATPRYTTHWQIPLPHIHHR